jgi:hypothetical protein
MRGAALLFVLADGIGTDRLAPSRGANSSTPPIPCGERLHTAMNVQTSARRRPPGACPFWRRDVTMRPQLDSESQRRHTFQGCAASRYAGTGSALGSIRDSSLGRTSAGQRRFSSGGRRWSLARRPAPDRAARARAFRSEPSRTSTSWPNATNKQVANGKSAAFGAAPAATGFEARGQAHQNSASSFRLHRSRGGRPYLMVKRSFMARRAALSGLSGCPSRTLI